MASACGPRHVFYGALMRAWPFTRGFGLLWAGQSVSIVGSGVAGFGLSVFVFQETGSATQFAVVMAFATLPMVLLWPVAGLVADRWGRRKAMLLSDAGACSTSAFLLVMISAGSLEIWHIYVAAAIHASFSAFQWPAFSAAIPDLVAAEHLGKANGLVELSIAAGRVLGPLTGGFVLATSGLGAVLAIDIATFLIALGTLIALRLPGRSDPGDEGSRFQDALRGWTFIRARPALFALIVFLVVTNFTSAVSHILLTPLVLSFSTEVELGTVLSSLGVGMLAGSLVMTTGFGPKNLAQGIILGVLVQGAAFMAYGLLQNVVVIGSAAFLYGMCLSIIRGTNQTLWQRKVSPDVLGRVTAFRSAVTGLPYPIAFVTAGVLVDRIFEPLLVPGGEFAGSVGRLIGTGPGRGTALLIIIAGLLTIIASVAAFTRLRNLHAEVPDVMA